MAERFFVEHRIESEQAQLVGPEVHHLIHVLRAKPGDSIVIFDGTGSEHDATVARIERSCVRLQVGSRRELSRELPFPLTLAVSMPRGERQKWLVEKLTELGVARCIPLVNQRTVAEPGAAARDKLRRTVIEAAKQCGRNCLLEIAAPQTWEQLVLSPPAGSTRWFAHPYTNSSATAGRLGHGSTTIAIGPEGGFTAAEVELAQRSGWEGIVLGQRILRIETAAVMVASLAAQHMETSSGGDLSRGSRPCS